MTIPFDNVRPFCIIVWTISHYKKMQWKSCGYISLNSCNQTVASRCCNYLLKWKLLFTSLDQYFLVPRFSYGFYFPLFAPCSQRNNLPDLPRLIKFFQISHSKEIPGPRDIHVYTITCMHGYKDNATLDLDFQPLAQLS